MLDFGQLQADIVKSIVKMKQKGRKADYKVFTPEWIGATEYVPVAYKEVIIFLIPRDEYLLDPKLWKPGPRVDDLFGYLNDETRKLTDTGLIVQSTGADLKVLADMEDTPIFVDSKLLKHFGSDVCFRIGKNRLQVYVLNPIGVEGLVCAVKVSKQVEDCVLGWRR